MKHITDFHISISQVGDQCLAEISRRSAGSIVTTALLGGHLSANTVMTEEGARYFAIKNFCLEISDELRAVLERMEIALT